MNAAGVIGPRTEYEYVSGLWDGSWDDYKTCLNCAELRKKMPDDDGCWPPFMYLKETYLEARTTDNYDGLVPEEWIERAKEGETYREFWYGKGRTA